MKQTLNEIEINGVKYVPKSEAGEPSVVTDGLPLVIIRTVNAGVHYGYLKSRVGGEAVLIGARRLWYWSGAASLTQLALDGPKNGPSCKFTKTIPEITVLGVIEVLPVSSKAHGVIAAIKEWAV
jgi:hypothetical protein